MQTAMERIADAICVMSPKQVEELAHLLVWSDEKRADRLCTMLGFALQDKSFVDTQEEMDFGRHYMQDRG